MLRTTQTPGGFCLPGLLLTNAQAGRCGGAKPRVSSMRTDQRMLFKFKSLVQKAAQRSSSSRVYPGAIAGEITNERKLLLMHQQLEIPVPPPGMGNPFTAGSHIQRASDGDGFGIPMTLITSPSDTGVCPSLSPLSSTSELRLPRGMWLTGCWQTPHPFQLCAVQFPSRGGEPGGNAIEVSGVVLHSLKRAGGDAKPGLRTSAGPPISAPCQLNPHLNLWHPFPN